ncbi:hypothetical protein [Aureibacter tunicatorum]|uniref:ElaB/YqjD/DUF883 family membrane-anchored ribosome-binding protein n=1 Tax=Aureibacter tunicatorum TaxID=866807 RepID=A0AAE4BQW3_9BACT|nr:hypothetical protein [Aureibacter tunicatorum]MDR6239604.1 ElaB/YqjD/DUF883 family membrane-anchored ribosome-binding protein [Aureibacter tunicatorum]BDD04081.1 hypothetical protein AUTU_15640 [Aureibacter tunicatorum]
MEKEQKKNERKSAVITFVITSLILLLVWYIKVWEAPDPPLPVYGIEMSFGFTETGQGNKSPEKPVTEAAAKSEVVEEIIEELDNSETVEEVVEETALAENVEAQQSEDISDVEDLTSEVEEIVETVEDDSDSSVEEVESSASNSSEAVQEVVEEQPKSSNSTKPALTYPSQETADAEEGNGNDNTPGAVGNEESKKNEKKPLLYSKHSGNGNMSGASLDLSGWNWDFEPKPDDNSPENGKVVFQIKIDDSGEVISVITLEKTVSSAVEQIYKREVESLTFSQTEGQGIAPPVSVGKITFIIRTN